MDEPLSADAVIALAGVPATIPTDGPLAMIQLAARDGAMRMRAADEVNEVIKGDEGYHLLEWSMTAASPVRADERAGSPARRHRIASASTVGHPRAGLLLYKIPHGAAAAPVFAIVAFDTAAADAAPTAWAAAAGALGPLTVCVTLFVMLIWR